MTACGFFGREASASSSTLSSCELVADSASCSSAAKVSVETANTSSSAPQSKEMPPREGGQEDGAEVGALSCCEESAETGRSI